MHKLYMHHGVALRGGRANRSAKLGWQKERARPARSYCQPMMHFIFILQVQPNRLAIYIYIYIYIYTGVVYPGFTQIVLDIGMELTIHMYT